MKLRLQHILHTSILTCLGFLFALSFFVTPPKVLAVCGLRPHNGANFGCSMPSGAKVFCVNSQECTDYKKQAAKDDTTYVPGLIKPVQKVFPDAGCTDGINTALGCIPYTTDAFGPALFGFLVGFAGLIALLLMLFAASLYITSGGDQEQLKKAKELFTAAVTGLVFIIFSVVLLRITAGDILKIPGF